MKADDEMQRQIKQLQNTQIQIGANYYLENCLHKPRQLLILLTQ